MSHVDVRTKARHMIDDISGMASLMSHHLRDIMAMTDSDIAEAPE
jgi:hypothetical protein